MSWLQFLFSYPDESLLIYGNFDPALVLLSVVIAIFTSSMALHMASQARNFNGRRSRLITLMAGSIAQGGGVWSMHFIGMLAFDLCTPVNYDIGLTLISVLPSVAASAVALNLNSKKSITLRELLVGGVLMGAGIGAMHYIGMAGMVMAPALRYDLGFFALSIVVAVVLSVAALWLRTGVRRIKAFATIPLLGDLAGGIGMGLAISTMHYVGMAAARFVPPVGLELDPDTSPLSVLLAIGVSSTTVIITCLVVAVDLLLSYRHLSAQARAGEKRIRGILQTAVDGIITIDHQGTILAVNQATTKILGWQPEELMGQNVKMLMPEPTRSAHDGYLSQYMATGVAHIIGQGRQVEAQHKEGELIPVRLAIGHVQLPNEDLFVGFITDLREQTKMENELKANEARFRSLIGNIPGAAYRCHCNERWEMLFISDAVESLTGYPASDFMLPNPKISFADLILAEDRVSAQVLEERPKAFEQHYRIKHRDGSVRWLQDNGDCVTDEAGKIIWIDGFIMDVTKRKQLDIELVNAKVHAEQAAMSRSAFLANMSHEIRTPMNAIIGFSDILMTTDLDKDQTKYLSTLNDSARSLLHLLNDILDVAKLEKGKLDLEIVDFSLPELADSVISTLWIQARKKGLQLEMNLSPGLREFYAGSSDRIRQVLNNIVGNAIKFTEQGKVTLDVYAGPSQQVVFRVTDTGIGIEEDRLQTIFEPFTQADASMSRRFGGTGLGTTISRQLVELMGGELTAHSRIGEGSCFQFSLPLQPGQRVPDRHEQLSYELPALNILAADDVQQNLDLVKIRLQKAGHTITCVRDGEDALRQIKYNEYDVILMDVQMPHMDGHTASRKIHEWRESMGLPHIPVIAMTAGVMESERQAAQSAGMDGFCAKPVDFNKLDEEIARVLNIPLQPKRNEPQPVNHAAGLFDINKGAALWGDRSTYLRELSQFSSRLSAQSMELHHQLERGEFDALAAAAHSLKGLSGNLTLSTLAAVFNRLESAARAQNFQDCCNSLYTCSTLVRQLAAEMEKLRDDVPANIEVEVATAEDQQAVMAAVLKLMEASERNSCDDQALSILMAQESLLGAETLQDLDDAFSNFEFVSALQTLQKINSRLAEERVS